MHLADTITNIGFTASLADSEVFMKAYSFGDGRVHDEYYTYIMVYVDDILIIDKDPGYFMDILKSSYVIKPDSIKPPTSYLGSDIGNVRINNTHCWTMSSQSYTKEAVKIVQTQLEHDSYEFSKKLSDRRTLDYNMLIHPMLIPP